MKVNYHTHTRRCGHAQGEEEDYIISAIESNIEVLGFSDHGPFPNYNFDCRMPYQELDDYLQELDRLTQKYSTDIILLKALEIEYIPEELLYYEDLLTKKHLDYLLLGQHFYRDRHQKFHYVADANRTEAFVDYAKSIKKALDTGLFKILAHADLFGMVNLAWDKNCDLATDIILDAVVSNNTILEYNANGLRREMKDYPDGTRYQYPVQRFWDFVKKANVSVVVGSDCHNPVQIWDNAMDQAYKNLESMGITPIFTL